MEKLPAKIKTKSEDFIVEEIQGPWHCKISEEFIQPPIKIEPSKKEYLWCEMEKRDIEHFHAIKEIAIHLKIHVNDIGYSGTKDKVAHTSQRISIFKPNLELLQTFKHDKIILKNFKWNRRKIKIGYLDANHFKITLRDIDKKEAMKVSSQIRKIRFFPNYFGPQRFGVDGKNLISGRYLLKRDFEAAAKMMLPKDSTDEVKNPIGLLKSMPRKVLLMHVCSIQSKIFNEIVEQALREGLDLTQEGQQTVPLMGYKTRFSRGRLGEIEQEILKKNDIELEDFRIEEIPHLKIKGAFRNAITPVEDLEVEIEDDELNPPAKKIILSFTLPSGTYATTFLENFFTFD